MTLHIRLIDLCLKAVADMSVLYLRIMASYVTISQTLCGIFTEKCPKHCPNFFGVFFTEFHTKKIQTTFCKEFHRNFTDIVQFLLFSSQNFTENFVQFHLVCFTFYPSGHYLYFWHYFPRLAVGLWQSLLQAKIEGLLVYEFVPKYVSKRSWRIGEFEPTDIYLLTNGMKLVQLLETRQNLTLIPRKNQKVVSLSGKKPNISS